MVIKNFSLSDTGQFIMTGLSGCSLEEEERDLIQKNKIGGVILFSHNYENPKQLTKLTGSIQSLATDVPLLIGVDQEGGRVQRFKDLFTRIPPMFDIGLMKSRDACFKTHQLIAHELKLVGVNLCFSPVCDILTNPKNCVIGDRAFGINPKEVGECVEAAIEGLSSGEIISVAKHFPGHGDTEVDSHFDLPLVKKSVEELKVCELIPFHKAVQSHVDMILMAHLQVDSLDSERITTVSPVVYQFLREVLQYNGVIISDDMEMKAVADRFDWADAAVQTLMAGCDILVYRSMACAKKAHQGLIQFLQKHDHAAREFNEKLARVRALKAERLA